MHGFIKRRLRAQVVAAHLLPIVVLLWIPLPSWQPASFLKKPLGRRGSVLNMCYI